MIKTLARMSTLTIIALVFSMAAYAQPGLVSYWPANGNANDIADGNNATTPGGAVYSDGVNGQAFSLNGSNYIQVPDSPGMSVIVCFI